jgi:hypothetical protein
MNPFRLAPLLMLVASVAGNVVLARAVTRPAATVAAAAPQAQHQPDDTTTPMRAPAGPCGSEVADLERQVTERSGALRAVLPASQLFEHGLPHRDAERVLDPIVAAALASLASPAGNQRIECRDVVCRLVFSHAPSASDEAWDTALSRHPDFLAWSRDFDLAERRPVADGALAQTTVYFKLNGPLAMQGGR